MNIKIIAVGRLKEKFLKDGIDEFLKRLKPYCSLEVTEISPIEITDENIIDKVLKDEGEFILSKIKPDSYVVTLEINGKTLSSEKFSSHIKEVMNSGVSELVFVIGSSCGLGQNISSRANFKLSLSPMTFLHQFARLILIEQIYRAFKIMKGEKYHK